MKGGKKFEFFDHTADVKFRAYGKTLEEAFANAAVALFEVMTDTEKVKPNIKHEIAVSANKKESLLFDFLEQFIALIDTEQFLLHKIEKITIEKVGGKFSIRA